MDYSKILPLIRERGLMQKFVSQSLDMTEHGFKAMIEKQSMKLETFLLMCKILNVSRDYFLGPDPVALEDVFSSSDSGGIVQNANGVNISQLAKVSKCEHEVEKLRSENKLLRENLEDVRALAGLKGKS